MSILKHQFAKGAGSYEVLLYTLLPDSAKHHGHRAEGAASQVVPPQALWVSWEGRGARHCRKKHKVWSKTVRVQVPPSHSPASCPTGVPNVYNGAKHQPHRAVRIK